MTEEEQELTAEQYMAATDQYVGMTFEEFLETQDNPPITEEQYAEAQAPSLTLTEYLKENFTGPRGEQGIQGTRGQRGPRGERGEQGAPGPAAAMTNHKHAMPSEQHLPMATVDVTVASTTVPYQIIGPMPAAGTITLVQAVAGENKTCGATSAIFDVHKIPAASVDSDGQGTTIFTTQGNRPTITNTHRKSSTTAPDVTSFAAGDYFAIYTDQVGTSLTVACVGISVTFP